MKRNYIRTIPLKEGLIRYKVIYEGFGVEFSTEIDAVNRNEAREKFKRSYSYVAIIKSIRKSKNGNTTKSN